MFGFGTDNVFYMMQNTDFFPSAKPGFVDLSKTLIFFPGRDMSNNIFGKGN